jgi:rod shape-determining protein MreB
MPVVSAIVDDARRLIGMASEVVFARLCDNGIVLCGDGATLKLLDKRLRDDTSIPVYVPEDPIGIMLSGAIRLLEEFDIPVEPRQPTHDYNPVTSLVRAIFRRFAYRKLAISLDGTRIVAYVPGEGITVNVPSVIARNTDTGDVFAVGQDAADRLDGLPNAHTEVGSPFRKGQLMTLDGASALFKYVIEKAYPKRRWIRPIVLIPVSNNLTPFARDCFREAGLVAGAADVWLIDRMLCAARGCGMPVLEPTGNMIVDLGSDDLEIAVITLGSNSVTRTLSGIALDINRAIAAYMFNTYNLAIGERTAEWIRSEIGSAYPLAEPLTAEVRGFHAIEGVPKFVTIDDSEIREAIAEPVNTIVRAVLSALESLPPELAADVVDRGIVLTGSGAMLKNLDKRLREETGVPLAIAEDPLSAEVLGLGSMIAHTSEWIRFVDR